MPISVTCQCGAKLEIDEKFLGKEVPCPDCNRPLPTKAAAVPPPLQLPEYTRTSGLAVLSLVLALVGAFTIVGTIAAIVVGVFAIKEIAGSSKKLGGVGFARAGIVVGAVGTFLTLAAFISPTVLGVDVFLRELAFAGRIQYSNNEFAASTHTQRGNIKLKRPTPPTQWASYLSRAAQLKNFDNDDLILVNVRENAFIACQTVNFNEAAEDEADLLKKVLVRFHRSELVDLIGRLRDNALTHEGTVAEEKIIKVFDRDAKKEIDKKEVVLDLRLGRNDWRFLIQYPAHDLDKATILVGAARRSNFERMKDDFHSAFDSKEESP